MTTSGSTAFNPVRDVIVKRALRLVGAFSAFDQPDPVQMSDAYDILNGQMKAWQADNFLWLRKFAVLTLVAGQSSYALGKDSSDSCVYQGTTTKVDRPSKIYDVSYKDSQGYEVPLMNIGRSDYFNLPTKSIQGRPTQFYYDPQMGMGKIYLWPVPNDATATVVLDIDCPIQDIITDQNTADFPQEWIEVLAYGLAVALAPEYGIPPNERQLLRGDFDSLRNGVLSNDRGTASVFFQVGRS